jgi:hypothetical protein
LKATVSFIVFELCQKSKPLSIALKILEILETILTGLIGERHEFGVRVAEPRSNGLFTSVAERGIPDIVRQTGCLNDTPELVSRYPRYARSYILANQRTERSADRCDFNAVRQTSMDVIVWRKEMDLRLICEASKSSRESNSVDVLLERAAAVIHSRIWSSQAIYTRQSVPFHRSVPAKVRQPSEPDAERPIEVARKLMPNVGREKVI